MSTYAIASNTLKKIYRLTVNYYKAFSHIKQQKVKKSQNKKRAPAKNALLKNSFNFQTLMVVKVEEEV